MVSDKFRYQLRQEAEQWWREGFIDAALYERLSDRYQFQDIETAASNRFVTILLGLGGILLGLGVITFVAANWQEWSREFRVILLLSLFISVNATGFYLWRRPTSNRGLQRLGHGLLLTGALILGANMGLMSQMFHQSGETYELFWVWGIGVIAMAYSLRLTSLGVMAWILLFNSFWQWWFSASHTLPMGWIGSVMHYMALINVLLFVPLAYRCRSRILFGMAGIAFATYFTFTLRPMSFWTDPPMGWLVALAFTLPPALLWVYDRQLWTFSRQTRRPVAALPTSSTLSDGFPGIARSLAVIFLSLVFYVFAFHWFWARSGHGDAYYGFANEIGQPWQYLDLVFWSVLTILGWLRLSYQLRSFNPLQERSVNSGAILTFLILSASIFLWHISLSGLAIAAPFLFNLMLFLLAIALLRDGLALGQRNTFWGGMTLLVLGIVSRMLEYNTDLLLKAFVFVLCGVGVILAGLWFERHLRPTRPSLNRAED